MAEKGYVGKCKRQVCSTFMYGEHSLKQFILPKKHVLMLRISTRRTCVVLYSYLVNIGGSSSLLPKIHALIFRISITATKT